jgi:thiol-disulfide isomerase/thioredoxin
MKTKNKKKTILQWVLVIAIIFAFRFYQQQDLLSDDAPIFNSKTLTGEMISSDSASEPILVHFWATWCVVCSVENANIQSVGKDYKVLNIAMQSGSDENIIKYATENDMDLRNIISDESGSLAKIFGAKATPTSFIIFKNKIKFIEVGYTTTWGLKLRLWLSKII